MNNTQAEYLATWDEREMTINAFRPAHYKNDRILSLVKAMREKSLDKRLAATSSHGNFGLCRYVGYQPEKPHVWFRFDDAIGTGSVGDGMIISSIDKIDHKFEDISLSPVVEKIIRELEENRD